MFKFLLVIFLIGLVGYCGVQIGTPYFNKSSFESAVEQIMQTRFEPPDMLAGYILDRAKDLGIPITAENIVMTTENGSPVATIEWSQTVTLPFEVYKQEYQFKVMVKK